MKKLTFNTTLDFFHHTVCKGFMDEKIRLNIIQTIEDEQKFKDILEKLSKKFGISFHYKNEEINCKSIQYPENEDKVLVTIKLQSICAKYD